MAEGGGRFLEVESLQMLIQALREYMEELQNNYNYLVQASEACQAAMGSDELGRILVEQLTQALEGLRVTAVEAEEVANNMVRDLERAMAARDRMQSIYTR